ncbi:MAG: hypothetical protein CVU84_02740 [Firmicutes bacterium HGW-Firmicutes-1]|jgi:hypothetical protein|nr:MAG: hypothetical protein CVU84_02740 [Firmicutes bacterium HGW-Firmicutes-1]
MSIRPLDMQVMVPKLQEVAQMKHMEQQRAGINQHDINHAQDKKNEKAHQSVEKTSEDNLLQNKADAKEKGNNEYNAQGKKKKKDKEVIEEKTNNGMRNKIDIKI